MAYITLNKSNLQHNYTFLDKLFRENEKDWAIVSKLLCGNDEYLRIIVDLGIREIGDARISNLKKIKKIDSGIETIYIKPPAKGNIRNVIKYADTSFNTEFQTIKWLSEEARKQEKLHKIIIMIELGDLREGIMGDYLVDFYAKIFNLPNIRVVGIGANLNCMYGVMPSEDKLIQLSLYKQLIEAKFKREIPLVTGGTSVVIPLIYRKQIPKAVNHFRVGETLYFGNNLFNDHTIIGMKKDIFRLHAEIIEITNKPMIPNGVFDKNPSGEMFEIDENDFGKRSDRAIIDVGVLDVADASFLIPDDPDIEIIGGSSDMLVLDLGNKTRSYKVGDTVSFSLKYMGALRLLNSDYVEKRVI
ncbi:MAG: alanine racemase [Cyclobacteriaceae bacterium]|nr:alanine racemase [Cyclobacteriaceae bacterium]